MQLVRLFMIITCDTTCFSP